MFAYCRNNPVCRKDAFGTEDVTVYLDDGSDGEVDCAPLDPEDVAPCASAAPTVGQSYGSGANGNHGAQVGQNMDSSSPSVPSPRFSPDQQAVIQLAKASEHSGLSMEEADILVSWAKEYGISFHGAMIHPGGDGYWSHTMHIKIMKMHIAIR